ncbi:PQQ-binding-like beta-propeller repeat protein [Halorarius litoreus]|uniref:outer membrane protein assembly factor BamB family protein n=1 Tax=Halorarius litoreus TaxID=2962676 RepID=UPI0020CC2410|nr:PQQ-binding-like beta-propeller repeat protein [Halorarius litoreus]
MSSRRETLAAAGGGLLVGLAGCSGVASQPDEPPTPDDGPDPDPENHIHGADGAWSSFGCNAGNTREVADGQAPVDGVTERWRVEVGDLNRAEPVVADGRVFHRLGGEDLVVYDAADGTELWRATDARTLPLVHDDTVYVGGVGHVRALAVEDGTERWRTEFDTPGPVATPATHGGDELLVGADEHVHRLTATTGEVEWSRRLFGRVVGPAAIYKAHFACVVTEAGKLYALDPEGTGWGEWDLPSRPQAPPTAHSDGVYVNCLDSRTYGISLENTSQLDIDWSAETGWANAGLAVNKYLYAAGTRGLVAIDPETGEERWTHDTGDWRHTAPALARDTLFVGGDALYAFDPTPSVGSGPALRFEHSLYGPVNAPVLDDGVLYVTAKTDESTAHLLALEAA